MKQFRYVGSMVSALPLRSGDVVLHPGKTVELPEDVDAVMTLAAKLLLVAASPEGQMAKDEVQRKEGGVGDTPAVPEAGRDAGAPSGRKSKQGA